MKYRLIIFDNHKIPKKYRKVRNSFYIDSTMYPIEKKFEFGSFEFGSTGIHSNNDKIEVSVAYTNEKFTIYLKPTEYSLTPLNSAWVV